MNIRELAKLAGVSPTAVSFVLNGRPGVSRENRSKIKQLLLENGYILKNEEKKPTSDKKICLVKCRSNYKNDDYSINVLDAVEQSAKHFGYSLNVMNISQSNYASVLADIDYVAIDGIVFLASEFTPECLKYTLRTPIPTVYIDIYADFEPINTINADQRLGSFLAARHLHSLGHRKVGYLRYFPLHGCLNQRFLYFKSTLHRLGMELDPNFIFEIDFTGEDAETQIKAALQNATELPTAIFADSDIIASSCVQLLQQQGVQVPQDVSVLGFDNTKLSSFVTPKITSIDIQAYETGQLAMERLHNLIEGPAQHVVQSYVSPTLIIRDSTACCRL